MKTCSKCLQNVRLVRDSGPSKLCLNVESGIGELTETGCYLYPVKPAKDGLCWYHSRERKYHGWEEQIEERRTKAASSTRGMDQRHMHRFGR